MAMSEFDKGDGSLSSLAWATIRDPFDPSRGDWIEIVAARWRQDRESRDYWNWFCGRDGTPLLDNVVDIRSHPRRRARFRRSDA